MHPQDWSGFMLSKIRNSPDAREGLFFAVFGVVAFVMALGYHVEGNIALSPASFPLLVSAVLIGLSLQLLYKGLATGGDKVVQTSLWAKLRNVGSVFVLGLLYVFAMSKIGFLISTMLYLFLFLLLLGEKRRKLLVLVPVVTSVTVYLFFSKLLSVMLP